MSDPPSYRRVIDAVKVGFHTVRAHVLRGADFVSTSAHEVRGMSANTYRVSADVIVHVTRSAIIPWNLSIPGNLSGWNLVVPIGGAIGESG